MVTSQLLTAQDIAAQTALELPDREMAALVNVTLLNGNTVQVPIGIAANVCAVQASVLAVLTAQGQQVSCTAGAGAGDIITG